MQFGIFEAIVISIPQTLAQVLFGLILLNENLWNRKKQIAAAVLLYSLASLLIRSQLSGYDIQIPVSYLAFFIVLWLSFRMSLLKTFSLLTIIYLESAILETPYFQTVMYVMGLTFEDILGSQPLFHSLVAFYNLLLFILAYTAYRFQWNIARWEELLYTRTKNNRFLPVLIYLMSFLATLVGIIGMIVIGGSASPIGPEHLQTVIILLLFTLFVSIFLIKKMLEFAQQHATNMAQEAYIENINELVTSIRSQRHDFLNHLQTIYGLCQVKKYDDLTTYVSNIIGEVREIETVVSVKVPALAALLRSKLATAQVQDIQMHIRVLSSLEKCKVKPFELVKIFGNLIDNALDAIQNLPKTERWITVDIAQSESGYLISVANGGAPIRRDLQEKIFDSGFSTKGNEGHSGIGLPTVRQLVKNYNGSINLDANANHPCFVISLPL